MPTHSHPDVLFLLALLCMFFKEEYPAYFLINSAHSQSAGKWWILRPNVMSRRCCDNTFPLSILLHGAICIALDASCALNSSTGCRSVRMPLITAECQSQSDIKEITKLGLLILKQWILYVYAFGRYPSLPPQWNLLHFFMVKGRYIFAGPKGETACLSQCHTNPLLGWIWRSIGK